MPTIYPSFTRNVVDLLGAIYPAAEPLLPSALAPLGDWQGLCGDFMRRFRLAGNQMVPTLLCFHGAVVSRSGDPLAERDVPPALRKMIRSGKRMVEEAYFNSLRLAVFGTLVERFPALPNEKMPPKLSPEEYIDRTRRLVTSIVTANREESADLLGQLAGRIGQSTGKRGPYAIEAMVLVAYENLGIGRISEALNLVTAATRLARESGVSAPSADAWQGIAKIHRQLAAVALLSQDPCISLRVAGLIGTLNITGGVSFFSLIGGGFKSFKKFVGQCRETGGYITRMPPDCTTFRLLASDERDVASDAWMLYSCIMSHLQEGQADITKGWFDRNLEAAEAVRIWESLTGSRILAGLIVD